MIGYSLRCGKSNSTVEGYRVGCGLNDGQITGAHIVYPNIAGVTYTVTYPEVTKESVEFEKMDQEMKEEEVPIIETPEQEEAISSEFPNDEEDSGMTKNEIIEDTEANTESNENMKNSDQADKADILDESVKME